MKDKKDANTRDWVDEDDERRFKEEREMVRRKLRKDKERARNDLEEAPKDRPKPRTPR